MKSNTLATLLAPFAVLANKHAMSPIYKALEIGPDTIRGCSPWGILEVSAEIGTTEMFWIDAGPFIGMIKTLPAEEVTFEQTTSTLTWSCGDATGKLALLSKLEMPTYEFEDPGTDPNIDAGFPEALTLGSLSASRDMGLSSAGTSGVALTCIPVEEDPNGETFTIYVTSSDNITMSVSSILIAGASSWPETIVIATEAATLLNTILRMSAGSSGAHLIIEEKTIIAYANDFRLMIRSAPPMKHNILDISLNYEHEAIVTKLPSGPVKSFVARATALAEAKSHTHVTLSAVSGGLLLAFEEGTITSNEQYAISDLEVPDDFPDVRLDALRLARALGHADMIAFDALKKGVITLFASKEEPAFSYLINGAQNKGK
jgi:hypothetical protein